MPFRGGRVGTALAPMFAAMVVAGCAENLTDTDPQVAYLTIVSGTGQSGPIGSLLGQPFVVRVADQWGNPVAGIVVRWEVVTGGGSVSPSQSSSDATGLAHTTLQLGTSAGVNTVAASISEFNELVFTAAATTAPPTNLAVVEGDAQTGTVGTQLPQEIRVRVTDVLGNPKAGVPVYFVVFEGSVSSASAVSDGAGIASVRWTLGGTAGTQVAFASLAGLPGISFTATARAGSPGALNIHSGNQQSGFPGSALPDSLRVRLVDSFGNPIAGVSISWASTPGGGTVNPTTSVTDADGRAATLWTLGSTSGPTTVVATGGGFSQSFTGLVLP